MPNTPNLFHDMLKTTVGHSCFQTFILTRQKGSGYETVITLCQGDSSEEIVIQTYDSREKAVDGHQRWHKSASDNHLRLVQQAAEISNVMR